MIMYDDGDGNCVVHYFFRIPSFSWLELKLKLELAFAVGVGVERLLLTKYIKTYNMKEVSQDS